jgi:hypothetical protein
MNMDMKIIDRNEFSKMELAIIEWFKENSTDTDLLKQLDSIKYVRTEYSGAGFYVSFDVNKNLKPVTASFPIDGPFIISKDIDNSAGSLLWGENGYLTMIEIYIHGDFINENINDFQILE